MQKDSSERRVGEDRGKKRAVRREDRGERREERKGGEEGSECRPWSSMLHLYPLTTDARSRIFYSAAAAAVAAASVDPAHLHLRCSLRVPITPNINVLALHQPHAEGVGCAALWKKERKKKRSGGGGW